MPFAGTAIRRIIQIRYSVPQDVRTAATVAVVRGTSMMCDQTLGGRAGGSTSVDASTGYGALKNRWVVQASFAGVSSTASPTKTVAHSRANGQATPSQPDVSPGQQRMSPGMSMFAICVETEDAMALPVTPILTEPRITPSRAHTKSSRWMIATNLMRQSWHGGAAVGRGAPKMCWACCCESAPPSADGSAASAVAGHLPATVDQALGDDFRPLVLALQARASSGLPS